MNGEKGVEGDLSPFGPRTEGPGRAEGMHDRAEKLRRPLCWLSRVLCFTPHNIREVCPNSILRAQARKLLIRDVGKLRKGAPVDLGLVFKDAGRPKVDAPFFVLMANDSGILAMTVTVDKEHKVGPHRRVDAAIHQIVPVGVALRVMILEDTTALRDHFSYDCSRVLQEHRVYPLSGQEIEIGNLVQSLEKRIKRIPKAPLGNGNSQLTAAIL